MEKERPEQPERLHGFDWLRCAAIIAVVCIHCSDAALRKNSYFPVLTPESGFYFAFNACMRFCVPTLLMMSAYLAERSRRETGKNPHTRWLRYLFPLVTASGFYTLLTLLQNRLTHHPTDARNLAVLIATGHAYYHTYFLFNLLCYALLHNVLRRLTCSRGFYGVLIVSLALFVGLDATFWRWQAMLPSWAAYPAYCGEYLIGMLPYYLFGIWAVENTARIRAWKAEPLQATVFIGLILCCWYGVAWHVNGFFSPGPALLAASLFCGAVRARMTASQFVARIGALSLGIYLWHPFVLVILRVAEGCWYREAISPAATFGVMAGEICGALAGSYLIAAGLQRFPATRGLAR